MKKLVEAVIEKDVVSFKAAIFEELSDRVETVLKEQMAEAVELTELSKTTLHNYIQKAVTDYGYHNRWKGRNPNDLDAKRGADKRKEGITKAVTKLAEEEDLTEAMSLSKTHKVHHGNDSASKWFAKQYVAAFKGDHREGGPTEADQAASEKFHSKWNKTTNRSGFAGSGDDTYSWGDHKFKVIRSPNGKGFHGTDHSIVNMMESEDLTEAKRFGDAKRLDDYNWPESDIWQGVSLRRHAENAISHGMHAHDALDHIFGAVAGEKREWVANNRHDLIKTFKSHGLKESEELTEDTMKWSDADKLADKHAIISTKLKKQGNHVGARVHGEVSNYITDRLVNTMHPLPVKSTMILKKSESALREHPLKESEELDEAYKPGDELIHSHKKGRIKYTARAKYVGPGTYKQNITVSDQNGRHYEILKRDVVKESEQLDEISVNTLRSYADKASDKSLEYKRKAVKATEEGDDKQAEAAYRKSTKHFLGHRAAIDKIMNKK